MLELNPRVAQGFFLNLFAIQQIVLQVLSEVLLLKLFIKISRIEKPIQLSRIIIVLLFELLKSVTKSWVWHLISCKSLLILINSSSCPSNCCALIGVVIGYYGLLSIEYNRNPSQKKLRNAWCGVLGKYRGGLESPKSTSQIDPIRTASSSSGWGVPASFWNPFGLYSGAAHTICQWKTNWGLGVEYWESGISRWSCSKIKHRNFTCWDWVLEVYGDLKILGP